jgi:hypothetical protein
MILGGNVMKYFEIGIGNTWLVRTEIELTDDYEFEVKGLVGGLYYESFYIRLWLGGKRVFIFDTKEGFKIKKKDKRKFKIIFGIQSRL